MGNKPLGGGGQSTSTATTVGHQTETPRPSKTDDRRKNKLFLNAFSIQSIGKVLSFSAKKKKNTEAVQVHQPNLDPPKTPPAPVASFAPLDYSEIAKTYEVDWTKTGVLGSGHYATVYRGKNLHNAKAVAVKKVNKKLTRLDSLRTEVEALRKVSGHPNIVELYDVYLDDDYMYLVLELLAGGELFDRIVSSGAYSERDAAIHMRKIGSALQYMHSKGIVHRDLKPENLVLADDTPDSPIKISDFGLSKILKDDEEIMMTICGTKAYSAPEVGFGFRQTGSPRTDNGYSSKVDMWSLGVILYVIVAAYHPFDPHGVDNDQAIWGRIVMGKWDFNDRVWDHLSDSLKDLLRKLIEVDPERRLSADEFLKHPWINDATTPVRPLPSLTRVRSSRYWHVQEAAAAAHAAAIAEAGESSDGPQIPEVNVAVAQPRTADDMAVLAQAPTLGIEALAHGSTTSSVVEPASSASIETAPEAVHEAVDHHDNDHNIV